MSKKYCTVFYLIIYEVNQYENEILIKIKIYSKFIFLNSIFSVQILIIKSLALPFICLLSFYLSSLNV